MKRILAALLAGSMLCTPALAIQNTPTPIVPPTELGETSIDQQNIVNVARLKLGFGTVAITVSGSAGSGTLNNAAGVVSLTAATAGASGATPSVITLNDNKAQVGDIVQCSPDQTGATAGAVLVCNAHVGAAGVITFTLYDATPTALTSSAVTLNFEIITKGNPN